MNQPDLTRLKATLVTSGLQTRDNPTYQVINQLIDATKQLQDNVNASIANITSIITNSIINNNENINQNLSGLIAGLDREESVYNDFSIPGPKGDTGLTGSTGITGSNGNHGIDGIDGENTEIILLGSITSGGTTTTPGGSNTQVQFNNSGNFGGDAGFVYDSATDTPTIAGDLKFSANKTICRNTVDGSDNGLLSFSGGGNSGATRGAGFDLFGNESATHAGYIDMTIGNIGGAQFNLYRADGTTAIKMEGSDGSLICTTNSGSNAWVFNTTHADGAPIVIQRSGSTKSRFGPNAGSAGTDDSTCYAPAGVLYLESSTRVQIVGTAVRFSGFGAGVCNFDASGNVSSVSDERLKNIKNLFTSGLAEILAINPINFTWKRESGLDMENTYTGFSAQNVIKFIPEAIGLGPDGYYTFNDRPIVAALVNAIKTLTLEIAELRSVVSLTPRIYTPKPHFGDIGIIRSRQAHKSNL